MDPVGLQEGWTINWRILESVFQLYRFNGNGGARPEASSANNFNIYQSGRSLQKNTAFGKGWPFVRFSSRCECCLGGEDVSPNSISYFIFFFIDFKPTLPVQTRSAVHPSSDTCFDPPSEPLTRMDCGSSERCLQGALSTWLFSCRY